MEKKDLKKLDTAALQQEVAILRKELFNLNLSKITGRVKDVSQFRKLKIQVARALTALTEQDNQKKGYSENKKVRNALG
jgi:ribosomal protein L29